MKFIVSTKPTTTVCDYSTLERQVRPHGSHDRTYLLELLDECTAYAEDQMECSLARRTITATFYADDLNDISASIPLLSSQLYAYYPPLHRSALALPRGPVISVTSVKDADGHDVSYVLECLGNSDQIRLTSSSIKYPLTVIYDAGYADRDDIPADIRGAIKTHVTTRYAIPEAIKAGTITTTTNLDAFYRQRGRGKQVY